MAHDYTRADLVAQQIAAAEAAAYERAATIAHRHGQDANRRSRGAGHSHSVGLRAAQISKPIVSGDDTGR